MKMITMSILAFFILCACSSKTLIRDDEQSYHELNAALQSQEAVVLLTDGAKLEGYDIYVDPQKITIDNHNISTLSIREIKLVDHGKGALKGMAYGALTGVALAGFGYLTDYYSEKPKPPSASKFEFKIEIPPIYIPVATAAVGGIIGAIHGNMETYVFPSARFEVSSVTDLGTGYLIIFWENKKIGLRNDQIYEVENKPDGKIYITIPRDLYDEKFK
jgi:hypothetical protein